MTTSGPLKEATQLLRDAVDDPGDVDGMPPGRDAAVARIAEALRARGQAGRRRRALRGPLLAAAVVVLVGGGAFAVHRSHRDIASGGTADSTSGRNLGPLLVPAQTRGPLLDPTGAVTALRDGRSESVGRGARLSEGTELRTSGSAEASLDFDSGTHVTLGGSSRVRLVEQTARKRFALEAGSFSAKVAKLTADERFVVVTPDAEVEVRGTAFRVTIVPGEPACEGGTPTRLEVSEGVVVVTHGGVQLRVGAGEHWPGCGAFSTGSEGLRGSAGFEGLRPSSSRDLAPAGGGTSSRELAPSGGGTSSRELAPAGAGTGSPAGTAGSGGAVAASGARGPSSIASSRLGEQNDLFDEAMRFKRAGDASGAVIKLDRLLTEYPSGPLAESAAAERMRLLGVSDPSRAPAAARDYLRRHPRGFARAEAEVIVGGPRVSAGTRRGSVISTARSVGTTIAVVSVSRVATRYFTSTSLRRATRATTPMTAPRDSVSARPMRPAAVCGATSRAAYALRACRMPTARAASRGASRRPTSASRASTAPIAAHVRTATPSRIAASMSASTSMIRAHPPASYAIAIARCASSARAARTALARRAVRGATSRSVAAWSARATRNAHRRSRSAIAAAAAAKAASCRRRAGSVPCAIREPWCVATPPEGLVWTIVIMRSPSPPSNTSTSAGAVSASLVLLAAVTGLTAIGCAHGERSRIASVTHLRVADSPPGAPASSKNGVAPRPVQPERTGGGPEDTSKKSASLETAGYTDTDHVAVFTPAISGTIENVVDGATLQGSYLVDVVSAASVDIVATASKRWHEIRHAGTLAGRYKPGALGVGFSASASSEPDYFSYGASGNLSYDLDEKNTSIFFGYGYGHDTIGRGGTAFTTFARSLQRGSFLVGLDQVIGPATLASLSLGVIIENGDQSKPYRYIPMFSGRDAQYVPAGASVDYVNAHRLPERPLEQLPLARRRFALAGTIAQRFETSTLRASERVYTDNWGLTATTTDTRWIFDVGERLRLWPHVRFHAQTPVGFWQRAYVSDGQPGFSLPEFRTGDRELGPLWAVTGGGGAKVFLGSAAHPQLFSVGFEADVVYTSYLDDLFITGRTGVLGSITLQLEEP